MKGGDRAWVDKNTVASGDKLTIAGRNGYYGTKTTDYIEEKWGTTYYVPIVGALVITDSALDPNGWISYINTGGTGAPTRIYNSSLRCLHQP